MSGPGHAPLNHRSRCFTAAASSAVTTPLLSITAGRRTGDGKDELRADLQQTSTTLVQVYLILHPHKPLLSHRHTPALLIFFSLFYFVTCLFCSICIYDLGLYPSLPACGLAVCKQGFTKQNEILNTEMKVK